MNAPKIKTSAQSTSSSVVAAAACAQAPVVAVAADIASSEVALAQQLKERQRSLAVPSAPLEAPVADSPSVFASAVSAIEDLKRSQRRARFAELREVVMRAGGGDIKRAAEAVLKVLEPAEQTTFADVFRAGAGSTAPFMLELAAEVTRAPCQIAASALARASQSVGWSKKTLRHKLKVPIGRQLWRGVKRAPVQVQKREGAGRPNVADKRLLAEQVTKFLLQHSRETSRFCHTKPRHRKARLGGGGLGAASAQSFPF